MLAKGSSNRGTIWDEDVLTAHNEVRFVCVVKIVDHWKTFSVVKTFPEELFFFFFLMISTIIRTIKNKFKTESGMVRNGRDSSMSSNYSAVAAASDGGDDREKEGEEEEQEGELNHKVISKEDVTLVEFMYLVLTRMPGKSYRKQLRSL